LIGLSLEQACEAAAWAGSKLNATSTNGHGRVGVVVAQSPPPGASAELHRQINVTIAAPWLPVFVDGRVRDRLE
jgi:beta-lactam-binding protein with PASTA domain